MGVLDLSAKNRETQQRTLSGTLSSCWEAAQGRKERSPRRGETWVGPAAPPHTQISHLLSPNFDFHIYKMMALDTTKDTYAV